MEEYCYFETDEDKYRIYGNIFEKNVLFYCNLLRLNDEECHKNKRFEEMSEKGQFYSEKVHTLTRFPNWYARHKVKKIIRKELSPEDYKLYGLDLTDALFVTGADLTEEETQTLVEAANV